MLRSTVVNIAALAVLVLVAGATFAATGRPAQVPPERGERGAEPTVEPAAETGEAEPVEPGPETAEATGFGAERSAEVRRFGECMAEQGGHGAGNTACAELKPGPAHESDGHPGRGPAARPESAGRPDGADDARPAQAGEGRPAHAGEGRPDHAGPPPGKGRPTDG